MLLSEDRNHSCNCTSASLTAASLLRFSSLNPYLSRWKGTPKEPPKAISSSQSLMESVKERHKVSKHGFDRQRFQMIREFSPKRLGLDMVPRTHLSRTHHFKSSSLVHSHDTENRSVFPHESGRLAASTFLRHSHPLTHSKRTSLN